jgi:hypothetical protein
MSADPAALQLRLLQTVVEVAAEKNSTLVMPFPVELLRFLDHATTPAAARPPAEADTTARDLTTKPATVPVDTAVAVPVTPNGTPSPTA